MLYTVFILQLQKVQNNYQFHFKERKKTLFHFFYDALYHVRAILLFFTVSYRPLYMNRVPVDF
jgi:hypothetical protein